MRDIENIDLELERSGKAGRLKALAESEDGRKISRMFDAETVEKAAVSGDGAAMRNIFNAVLQSEEGRRLAADLMELMQD